MKTPKKSLSILTGMMTLSANSVRKSCPMCIFTVSDANNCWPRISTFARNATPKRCSWIRYKWTLRITRGIAWSTTQRLYIWPLQPWQLLSLQKWSCVQVQSLWLLCWLLMPLPHVVYPALSSLHHWPREIYSQGCWRGSKTCPPLQILRWSILCRRQT